MLRRLSDLVCDHQLKIFAWALMSDHFHLLVQTGQRPLEHCMRSLLTGFATVFNRRHGRVGHVFQNRYKSVVCEVERYFLELVRYIHLNPLRGGLVSDFDALDDYPYTGHSALLGAIPRGWQSTEPVLERFSRRLGWARAAYRKFVSEGVLLGKKPDLAGGGLVRSAGGWNAVKKLRQGRESFASDERVLGGSRFVDEILREVNDECGYAARSAPPDLHSLIEIVCAACGVTPVAVNAPGQTRAIAKAREGIAYLWVEFFGQNGRRLASDVGLKPSSVYKAVKRGRQERDRWIVLLNPPRNVARPMDG